MNDCLGTDMMFAFAALVISFPGRMINRLWFLPLGWVGVQLINIVRIVGLTLVWLKLGPDSSFDTHDAFNFFTTLFVLGMFMVWVRLYRKNEI
jgi:exosortase/archaeosortase family protein